MKGMLIFKIFAISRNELTLERRDSPFWSSEAPRYQSIRLQKIKGMVHIHGFWLDGDGGGGFHARLRRFLQTRSSELGSFSVPLTFLRS